jgi:hypothetical protein
LEEGIDVDQRGVDKHIAETALVQLIEINP